MINSIGGMGSYVSGIDQTAMQQRRDEMFAKIDQNGDGSLDKAEFSAMAEKMSQRTGETVDIDQLFADIDTNSDGVLDQEELDAHAENMRAQMPPPPPPPEESSESGHLTQTLLDWLAEQEETESVNLFA